MAEDELEKITSDFQCFVCGAVFTTDQDRRQHLEKEMHGKMRDSTAREEEETAKKQTEQARATPKDMNHPSHDSRKKTT